MFEKILCYPSEKTPSSNENFPSRTFVFVGAMLVRVGIRIDETGFLETFQVLIIYVNVWSKQLPF